MRCPLKPWYIVRDLGMALGDTGRIAPTRNDPDVFARTGFIAGVENGFVRFDYHGWHQELVRNRIEPDDLRFVVELLSQPTDRQWRDAFRAGGYSAPVADRFIGLLSTRIAHAKQVARQPPAMTQGW
jgi:hypothetical protein